MKTIVCHPDNLELVRDRVNVSSPGNPVSVFAGIRFITNEFMDRDRPSGKYRLPDGSVVAVEDIVVRTRFVTYGPEDLYWLLYAGIVREEREPLYYILDDTMFRMSYDFAPMLSDFRSVIATGAV